MNDTKRLIGSWRTDPNDLQSIRQYGDVSLTFTLNGRRSTILTWRAVSVKIDVA
jgi:hypothetical protein